MNNLIVKIIMIFGFFLLTYVGSYIGKQKNKTKLHKYFRIVIVMLQIHIFFLFWQLTLSNSHFIKPVYFEYLIGCEAEYLPVMFLIISLFFYKKDVNVKKMWWLFIIPTISILMLWTNDIHHLYFLEYSTNISEIKYGSYFPIHSIYSYLIFAISMLIFIKGSIKNSGFFSLQTALIITGCMIPITVNILGTMKIIKMTVYLTPMTFIATAVCFALSIIKYKALNITPVAFRTVMDTMSDAYVVISDDGTIVTFNKTFENKFGKIFSISKDDNLFDAIEKNQAIDIDTLKKSIKKTRSTGKIITEEYHFVVSNFSKYFEVDIHPIATRTNSKEYIGTLLLFKDITQHKEDIKEIEEKQDIIVKQQQLVSIGELAGGVAHDINTPIAAIKTGILMLTQMGSEKTEEEKEILQRMDNCATKIINIVNSMRNQIRNLGSDTNVKFKISEVVNDIKIITYHEVGRNKSEVIVNILDDLEIKGDPTKLGQVLTNLVVNAAQAYGTEKGGKIELTVEKAPNNMAMIKITDYAGGLKESIIPYVFKNILTTKGTAGTGLGLYLAYSVIKGNFNGDITFDTAQGAGTTFYIVIPRA